MYEEHKWLVVDFCITVVIHQNADGTDFFFG
jgi:hypothetical protein